MQRSPRPSRTSGAPEASNPALLPETPTTTPFAADASRRPKRTRAVSAQRTPTLPAVESEEDSDSEQCITFEGDEGLDVSFPLKAIEKIFRCSLCSGYFRDAVTIKECLHTFCRWCLYDYVDGGETEEVCCPYCERNMQLLTPHRDGAGKDCRHYMPRVTAACVAGAGGVVGGSNSSGATASAPAANAAVLFDRTMQNVVDKLFPHFAYQERLEEEELQRYMQLHQHKQLPPEYLTGCLTLGPFRREAVSHRRARLEARAAAEEALGYLHLKPSMSLESKHEHQQALHHQQQQKNIDAPRGLIQKDQRGVVQKEREGLRSNSRRGEQQKLQQQQSLDEFVDQLLGSPTFFDDQQTTAIALLPDTYQGQLMEARVQHQAAQSCSGEGALMGESRRQEAHGLPLPLKLPLINRPYLRVPSRMSIQLVLRYLALQLQPLLFTKGPTGILTNRDRVPVLGNAYKEGVSDVAGSPEDPLDLEVALELTLEGRVLGRSHSIDFVRKARRLNCAGKCLLLQYRYSAQTEARVIAYHVNAVKRGCTTPQEDSFVGRGTSEARGPPSAVASAIS
ncbi:zinc finger (C3HC4 RING finger) protein, putative [Eimeria tenella]|uniref:Zinc finger (C3HC4 RING finger) protein, putative n=1 Tax=Eimeria tenella TaxID=5802 RepID=U6KRE0_EIMTE|nr:zinc finger (C3HC4 RING finger) protein, putative [Eimeria tenella]CDJ40536.1 zinc finger (C3HC4 RING finger) protein, putative [Eimeria tenella]|eukprot:XP_013231286.1 zinc finger (C3HC4 RING finger) protein, putative [Eimeria tenella]